MKLAKGEQTKVHVPYLSRLSFEGRGRHRSGLRALQKHRDKGRLHLYRMKITIPERSNLFRDGEDRAHRVNWDKAYSREASIRAECGVEEEKCKVN